MIVAALRAGLVLLAALLLASPAIGDPGGGAATPSVGGDLRSEYPLHDSKQCCSSAPAPAAAIHQPGAGVDGQVDDGGGLTLWLLALALASCLGLAWFVHSRPETIPRVDLSRAGAIAGAVPQAVRRIDLTPVREADRKSVV